MAEIKYPAFARNRGSGYWLRPSNIWASRRAGRRDHSNEWRYQFTESNPPPFARSTPMQNLLERSETGGFRFVVAGDTGEGDRSQYGLVPVIRAFKPDFMIINGDVAYPAGRLDDFREGFFEPYAGVGIPIWATPGNHEYYSKHRGREFFEIFCTGKQARLWAEAGLRLVPQPSTFWELRSEAAGLVVLGIDTGMKANLDGKQSAVTNWLFGRKEPDRTQHLWLKNRLQVATARGEDVIVLFHIPALKREAHDKKTHLTALHQTLAGFSCVRLVACGHDHNYQKYTPETFYRYLMEEHDGAATGHAAPDYLIAGAGGAALSGTSWSGPYSPAERFPSSDEWAAYATWGRKQLQKFGNVAKWLVSRVVEIINKDAVSDADAAQYLNFLLVEVAPGSNPGVCVTPILLPKLAKLFSDDEVVDVRNPPPIDPGELDGLRAERDKVCF